MRRLNTLWVCSCCGKVTRFPAGDVCRGCWAWAENSLVDIISAEIQAELPAVEVDSALVNLDKVKAARKALGI